MKLKKIPKATRFIKFENTFPEECKVYLNKEIFLVIAPESFSVLDCHNYFFQMPPMKEFPQWQFYSNIKIEVEYF